MSYEQFPTHLGGKLANLAWEDLTPSELVQATVGSSVKAYHLLELADAQIAAAQELADTNSTGYEDAKWILTKIAAPVLRQQA